MMNSTSYNDLYDWFLQKVSDIDILKFEENDRNLILKKHLRFACTQFKYYCKKDLLLRDDDLEIFKYQLSDEVLDILSELMIVSWLKPYVNHYRNLENLLNTSDFNNYSPANMLNAIKKLYDERDYEVKLKMNEYTFRQHNLEELKGG